jgi:HK97 gp10 family phage protein
MKGKDRILRKLRFLASREFEDLAGAVIEEAADAVRAEAFQSISRGSVSGAGHVPSKPGEPPNRNEGTLQAGLSAKRTGLLSAEVRAEAAHSAPLEFGTSKMAARPFMRPARDKEAAGAIEKGIAKMNKQIRRKTRGS